MNGAVRLYRDGVIAARTDGVLELVLGGVDSQPPGEARAPVCGSGACGGCRPGIVRRLELSRIDAGGQDSGRVDQPRPGVGDVMELSVANAGLVRIAVRAFGVPLAGLLAGASIGHVAGGEAWSIALGGAGLAAGLAWLHRAGRVLENLLELELRPRPIVAVGNVCRRQTGVFR